MVSTYFTDVEYEAEWLSEQLKAIKKILYQSPDQKGGTADSQCYAKIPLSVKIGLWIILKANSNALWVSALQMLLVLLRKKGLLYQCAAIIIPHSYKHLQIFKPFTVKIQQNTLCANLTFQELKKSHHYCHCYCCYYYYCFFKM